MNFNGYSCDNCVLMHKEVFKIEVVEVLNAVYHVPRKVEKDLSKTNTI